MAIKIGLISQKGGVGKSTLSRAIAREYSQSEWQVLIADLDTSQSTSFEWNTRRLEKNIEPYISVQQFPGVDRVLKVEQNYDLLLFDGAPHATRASEQIAQVADLVILPTGTSKDDLNPQIRLAYELAKKGIDKKKICFVLARVGMSEIEIEETREYLAMTGYEVLKGYIPDKTGYRRAMDDGRALTETNYSSLNEKADEVIQAIVNKITSLNQ